MIVKEQRGAEGQRADRHSGLKPLLLLQTAVAETSRRASAERSSVESLVVTSGEIEDYHQVNDQDHQNILWI